MKTTFIPLICKLALSTLLTGCKLHPYAGTAPLKSGADELDHPKYVQLCQLDAYGCHLAQVALPSKIGALG